MEFILFIFVWCIKEDTVLAVKFILTYSTAPSQFVDTLMHCLISSERDDVLPQSAGASSFP